MTPCRASAGSSVKRQTAGCQVVAEYEDPGISAHNNDLNKRPQFRHMLDDAKLHKFDVVYFAEIDRISRDTRMFSYTCEELTRHGIKIMAHGMQVDYKSADGKLMAHIFAAQAQHYSDKLSERVPMARKSGRFNGRHNGSHVALGYVRRYEQVDETHHADRIEINPETETFAREMWRLAAMGRTIVRSLPPSLQWDARRTATSYAEFSPTDSTSAKFAIVRNGILASILP